jgi:hypothetical protein
MNALSTKVPSRALTTAGARSAAKESRETPLTAYASLLKGPVAMLAGNVLDRSDVTSIAILGYN